MMTPDFSSLFNICNVSSESFFASFQLLESVQFLLLILAFNINSRMRLGSPPNRSLSFSNRGPWIETFIPNKRLKKRKRLNQGVIAADKMDEISS